MRTIIITPIIAVHIVLNGLGCSSSSSDGGNVFNCGDSTGVYVRTNGDNSNTGVISQPLRTIQAAASCAQSGQAIRVANGSYETNVNDNEKIILSDGISMYGGYSSDFQVRDAKVYPTIIADTTDTCPSTFPVAQTVGTNITSTPATVIDGFTINGTTVGICETVRAVVLRGDPTFSNNVINSGGGVGVISSKGIDIQSGSPTIINNTINGGIATAGSSGITSVSRGPVTISNNVIKGGSGTTSSAAISLELIANSGSLISNNSIEGGSGSSWSSGIQLDASAQITIEANTITGGGGDQAFSRSHGIYTEGGAPNIRNNTIALESVNAYGIYSFSNSVISNNTIVGGGSDQSWGIYTKLARSAVIQNNLVNLVGGVCIAENDTNSDPAILKNNDLIGCANLYFDEGLTNITVISNVNALPETDASNNISLIPNLDATQDYRLTGTTPQAIAEGGLDLSIDFDTDKAGAPRTIPWSIGAYEYD